MACISSSECFAFLTGEPPRDRTSRRSWRSYLILCLGIYVWGLNYDCLELMSF